MVDTPLLVEVGIELQHLVTSEIACISILSYSSVLSVGISLERSRIDTVM